MTSAPPVPRAELEDPDVLADHELDALLVRAPWRRLVVVGDSVGKGVGDASPGYRHLTWAERLAAALGRVRPGLEYANLATPEQTAAEIRDTQLARALELEPDLIGYVGGGNDLLAPQFDLAPVASVIDETVAALTGSGATVITYSIMDLPSAFPPGTMEELDRRLRDLNDAVAQIAERHRTVHVDLHSLPFCSDPAMYSADLKHGTMRCQAIVASVTVQRLAERIAATAVSGR